MSEQRNIGGIPRYRATSLPALFSQGFRPFFLSAAIWAELGLALWLLELSGFVALPTHFQGAAWHAHEMIFGFASAAMAGFLMTVVPNWTGRMPLQGAPLLLLWGVWLLGRVAIATSAAIGAAAAAILDLAFPVLLVLALGREVVAGRNWRNLPMIGALCLLLAANVASHLSAAGLVGSGDLGSRGGIALFSMLIALVGGRIIPSFTRNRLVKMGSPLRPAPPGASDRFALTLIAAAACSWAGGLSSVVAGPLLVAAGIASAVRLARWRGWRTFSDPSLWILHLGHGWLAAGLLLLGASEIWSSISPMAGLHALGTGAIGTSILGVMGRATPSHAGRRGSSVVGATTVHLLVTVAATMRVLAPLVPVFQWPLLWIAAVAWFLAFGLFIASHGRALFTPRHLRT